MLLRILYLCRDLCALLAHYSATFQNVFVFAACGVKFHTADMHLVFSTLSLIIVKQNFTQSWMRPDPFRIKYLIVLSRVASVSLLQAFYTMIVMFCPSVVPFSIALSTSPLM